MILSHKFEHLTEKGEHQELSVWIQIADSLDLEDASTDDFNVELLTPSGTHNIAHLLDNAGVLYNLIHSIDWAEKYYDAKVALQHDKDEATFEDNQTY